MRSTSKGAPTRELERELLDEGATLVAGFDEVGRGALAGPVTVGVCVVSVDTGDLPTGIADSKLLSAPAREAALPKVQQWAAATGVGEASNEVIDDVGITSALRQAGLAALEAAAVRPDVILVDGSHNWLGDVHGAQVRTIVKGDMTVGCIAAASILAKVHRDAQMIAYAADFPEYGWASNKGYGAAAHRAALVEHGTTPLHRHSWNLLPEATLF